jgi:hypothetical protein
MGWQVRFALLPNRWWDRLAPRGRDHRLARFRQVLLAAHRTRGYREALETAGLASSRSIARLRSIEDTLPTLPCLSQAEFRAAPWKFSNPGAPPPARQRLWRPWSTRLRAAVLCPNFQESDSVRIFDPDCLHEIKRFDPAAIAAPLEVLLSWTASPRHGRCAIPTPPRALIAFTGLEGGGLPDAARDMLWRAFEVPVFEQRLGSDGSVLAWECEAHEGLHVAEQNAVFERSSNRRLILTSLTDRRRPLLRLIAGFTATLETDLCPCGQPGPRLLGVSTAPVELPDSLASLLHN